MFDRVALIGLGLIGSSIAWGIKANGLAKHVVGYARSAETRDKAMQLGFLNSVTDTAAKAAEGADLVILCAPVGVMEHLAKEVGPKMKAGAILSDVGSVKQSVIDSCGKHLPDDVHLIPAHPIAGTEHSGPEAGFASLFNKRWCIITPPEDANAAAVTKVQEFWAALGSDITIMSAEHHDRVLAVTSHLPHLIAYTIVGTADDLATVTKSEVIKYSASGFRDFTRIAASDPVMWRDIFLNNKEGVLELLSRFNADLSMLETAIKNEDGAALEAHFTRTRSIRRGIIEQGQDVDAPDFGRSKIDDTKS